jgi:putative Holliday junction resolvase
MIRLAIDYGRKRAGIAITDNTSKIIIPYKVIKYDNIKGFFEQIAKIFEEVNPEEVILGLPLNMNGTESEMSREVKGLAQGLKRIRDINIVFYDERLTTFEAQQLLTEQGVSARRQKEIIDMYSAYCILKSYLNELKEKGDA